MGNHKVLYLGRFLLHSQTFDELGKNLSRTKYLAYFPPVQFFLNKSLIFVSRAWSLTKYWGTVRYFTFVGSGFTHKPLVSLGNL